jgi:OOP family OmpA-OmpF porin
VHFNFDKSDIRAEDEPVLDEAVRILKEEPGVRLYVDGYCDAIGGDEYNQALSERRANSVSSYMESAGITPGRLVPRGFGKTHFVADNDTDQGRAQNRRVELIPIE